MRNPYLTALVALVLVISAARCVSAQTPEQAQALIEQGRIAEAHAALQQWLKRVPDDPVALVLLATIEFDGARSQEYYRRARQAAPEGDTAPKAIMGIAKYYFARGFYSTAHRLAQQVIDTFPTSDSAPWASLLVGRCLLASGEPAEAAKQVERLRTSSRTDMRVAATGVWAEAMLADGRPQEVIRALSVPGWSAFPYELSLLARAYRANGERTKARNARWRGILARRRWTGDTLRHVTLEAPTIRISEENAAEPVRRERPVQEPRQPETRSATGTVQPPQSAPKVGERAAGTGVSSGNSFRDGPKGFSLQVGAFGNPDNALRIRNKLREAGYEVIIRRTGSLHRVWVGNYPSIAAARAASDTVRQVSGLTPAIVRNR